MKNEILLLGSLAYDYIMDITGDLNSNLTIDKENHIFNLALMPQSKKMSFGGTAGNISYNLALLKTPVHVITAVGRDFVELGYQDRLNQFDSLVFEGVIHPDLFTASCYIVNDSYENQLIIFHEGAMQKSPSISLLQLPFLHKRIKIACVSPDNYNAMLKWIRELNELDIPFVFDPGQVTPSFTPDALKDILPKALLVIGNKFEIDLIAKKLSTDIEGLLGLNRNLIITLSEKGSICYENGKKYEIPPCRPTQVMDPTGAGDGYRAGLLYGLLHDFPIHEACFIGSVIGSFVVETIGPQTQTFDLADVKQRFHETYFRVLDI